MKKVIIFFSLLILGIIISSFSKDANTAKSSIKISNELQFAPTEEESFFNTLSSNIPFVGNSFNGFKEAVAFKESQGKYHVINTLGYLGKYQFGKSTLKRFKINNTQLFLETPELQEDAFIALCSVNKWILRKDIKRSVGKKINGIEITESGIIAAAHLSGAGNVKKYLRSNGKTQFKDAYGSSIQHYLKLFSGYDTSFIEANKKPIL
ncbi:MAG: peptidoglycan-binding protein LysM [Lutibacter sp.]|uniref:peptidoglycan-binding protein LysM n=1 Tax=Lutibacter sp. TaxID=1925666 RepID=UPI001844620C|nr:peptidoglycan-binding protein LysM [Lutibacter sp.]MBT8316858.1 peptidoglycan-binding protein LysM [Lutibacter sp.]NNJ57718.1 peptidoglycan-binding protein LysM [Lutibacter sp.]